MLKHEVVSIQHTQVNTIIVTTAPSVWGNGKIEGNNMVPKSVSLTFPKDLDIKVGDIVRCDGFPFKIKPTLYYFEKGYKNHFPSIYKQVRLNNGFWVIR